jgi:hypothetical protein
MTGVWKSLNPRIGPATPYGWYDSLPHPSIPTALVLREVKAMQATTTPRYHDTTSSWDENVGW